AYDRVQVEHARLQHGAAAERQQLPGKPRRTHARVTHLAQRSEQLVLILVSREEELRMTGDDREQVVEVVSNPARELTDGVHLLRLLQLLLERTLPRDVTHDPREVAAAVEHELAHGELQGERRA